MPLDRKTNSGDGKKPGKKRSGKALQKKDDKPELLVRLNRYIAQSGVCSRREADKLITEGKIKVNGKKITELGAKVKAGDKVEYSGKRLNFEKPVYVLLNKPKDFISSSRDEKGRKTVLDLVKSVGHERLFPVGRLDKNTTGLLLLTNDGELTKRLTHPSYGIEKIYHLATDKEIKDDDIEKIRLGFDLEDGFIKADEVSRIQRGEQNEIGIKLHSGRNRIIRRMMEHLGYQVTRLDRVVFANLNKKDLSRGKWRRLSPQEITYLKRMVSKKDENPA